MFLEIKNHICSDCKLKVESYYIMGIYLCKDCALRQSISLTAIKKKYIGIDYSKLSYFRPTKRHASYVLIKELDEIYNQFI